MKEVEVGSECGPCIDRGLSSHRRTEEHLGNAHRDVISQTPGNTPSILSVVFPGSGWKLSGVRFSGPVLGLVYTSNNAALYRSLRVEPGPVLLALIQPCG